MARYRLSEPAKADIASILRTSEERHGRQTRIRYSALLTAAMRRVATEPDGVSTANRDELPAREFTAAFLRWAFFRIMLRKLCRKHDDSGWILTRRTNPAFPQ
ncbi:hypothetical protein [Rhodomicrobium lacus]|uniref:hypothetical protein n=1 Tax=Rhodomicrobium lacus TaxID=2498452 RepID=UPI0015F2C282|nr:hypothetical protein [Rhodomicrobium lacus]